MIIALIRVINEGYYSAGRGGGPEVLGILPAFGKFDRDLVVKAADIAGHILLDGKEGRRNDVVSRVHFFRVFLRDWEY